VTDEATIELFRPVGPRELARIAELDWRAFPPRLHHQPIFYPVLNERYARKIARDWNASNAQNGYEGYVTRFRVAAAYAGKFATQTVGANWHQELWVPAEELDEFNRHIVGLIEVVAGFRGGPDREPSELGLVAETGTESQVLEWKSSLAERKRGLQSLCGMLNAEPGHGTVEFGIGPHGEVLGVEAADLDKTQRSLAQEIGQSFQPRVQLTISAEERAGKRVIVVEGRRNRDVPYHEYDGRAWVREGTVTRQLSLAEKQSLQRQRNRDLHSGPWKCDRCGSWVGVLSSVTVTPQGPIKSYDCDCGGEYWPV